MNKIILSCLWLALTVSLGTWWFIIGLKQASTIEKLRYQLGEKYSIPTETFQKQYRMLTTEGVFFLSMLTTGGITLIWLTYRESKRVRMLKDFFSIVSHEMKTPLASLRLQAESLGEELEGTEHQTLTHRLIEDSKRLELQMEKALYLASINRSENLYLERVPLFQFMQNLGIQYPILQLVSVENAIVYADRRALESIIKNIIENSILHGSASKIEVNISQKQNKKVSLIFKDNGIGFQGDKLKIGKPFFRHNSKSGSGIGMYLIKQLVKMMDGSIHIPDSTSGFSIEIILPEWRES